MGALSPPSSPNFIMTIQSINAYTPSRPSDPSLDRVWATKDNLTSLEEENGQLRSKVELLESQLSELTEWQDSVKIELQQLWEQFGL